MQKSRRLGPLVAVALACATVSSAQHYQADFPPEEFRARWTSILERIGNEAVAVAQGAPLTSGFQLPRQSNTFYYLCGIETPGSYLLLDGRTRRATLYLPPRNERLERSEGKVLSAEDAELVRRLVGVDEVRAVTDMGTSWPVGDAKVAIYAEHAPAEGHAESRHELKAADTAIAADPWDGRLPRETVFRELLRLRNPRATIRDLTPILDDLRSVKSPREIALVRRASQLAGLGVLEAMRSTEPGAWEYQLDAVARYVFLQNGARLDGYRSITASGTDNIWNGHYYRNDSQLREGDLVLMDYAPDYRYYVSDIGRMWPVGGTYAPWQRELLQFVLEWRNAILPRIRPGVTTDAILAEARAAMEPVAGAHALLEARVREGGAQDAGDERRRLLAPRRHGRARRGRVPGRAARGRARCSRSTRSCGCRRTGSTSATRTRWWSRRRASRTSRRSCPPSSTPSRRWCAGRASSSPCPR